MKNGKIMKEFLSFAATVVFACTLTACGSSNSDSYAASSGTSSNGSYSYYDSAEYVADYSYETADADYSYDSFGTSDNAAQITESGSASVNSTARKLIKNVDMEVETKNFDELIKTLENDVTGYGGYIEEEYTYNGSGYNTYYDSRYANFTVRIPQDRLDAFVGSFSGMCNVLNKTESVDDVTLTYVDLESHREALEIEQDRLLELLEQAEDITDIITIEDRLTEVRYEIESMESQLRTYDNQINYSTVRIYVSEVTELTQIEPEPVGFGEKVSSGFVSSLKGVGKGFKNFAIWFITALPHLVVWGLIIFGIVMAIRGIVRHNKKKNQKKREKTATMQQKVNAQTPANAQQQAANEQAHADSQPETPKAQQ